MPPTPFERGEFARKPVLTTLQKRTRAAKRVLAASGLVEAVTWSFISKAQAETFGGGAASLSLANPIAAELSDMRPSLIPGLALAAQKNADRGYKDSALFETGQIFLGDKPEDQLMAATSLRRGTAKVTGSGRHWSGSAGAVDVFDAKADALETLRACGASVDQTPDRGGRARLPASRPLRHDSARAEKHPRAFRRVASPRRSKRSASKARSQSRK